MGRSETPQNFPGSHVEEVKNILMMSSMKIKWLLRIMLLMAVFPGCSHVKQPQGNVDQWIAQVANRELADSKRLEMIDKVLKQPLDEKQRAELGNILAEVAASPLHSPVIRSRAVEIIPQRYPENAPQWLGRALLTTSEPEIQEQILKSLAQLNQEQAIPFLVEAYGDADPGDPLTMKIALAIELLGRQPLDAVLQAQLLTGETISVKLAALASLLNSQGQEPVLGMLAARSPEDVILEQVAFWGQRFHYFPTNKSRFLMCQLQRITLTPLQFDELEKRIAGLHNQDGYTFDARDSYMILQADPELLSRDRDRLVRSIASRLERLSHTSRPPSYPGAPDDYPEDFAGQQAKLSAVDLLRINLLLDTLAQPEPIHQIRRYVVADRADAASEYGGLCFLEEGAVTFQKFASQRQGGDNQYFWSGEMLQQRVLSLAVWHCHTNKNAETQPAGPGLDDIRHAAWHDYPGLVISLLRDDAVNIDYYTPEGFVVDLGNY